MSSLNHGPEDRATRLDKLQARAEQAARRAAALQAGRNASSEYASRLEREAQTGLEVHLQAEARDQAEMEM